MSEETRRLVAILFSDIVGYTAAMGRDEEAAVRAVSKARAVQRELVRRFHGEWLQEQGDGVLCTFGSAVEAVGCALEIQRTFGADGDFQLRIGIHVGDLIFRETDVGYDVFGDGVNVAARIQGVAAAGGICISERVFDDLRNHPEIETRSLGKKHLKNVNRPLQVYRVIDRGPGASPAGGARRPAGPKPVRARLTLAAAGAVALAALGAVAVFLGPGRESTPPEPTAKPSKPTDPAMEFARVRRTLLGAAGPLGDVQARVWTDPDPVEDNGTYRVLFRADCDCEVLLFSVDGSKDEISLLYPNPYETPRRLQSGQSYEIPSSGAYNLRAVGGRGMDMLKLFVARESFDFPPAGVDAWAATPAESERVAELARFLDNIQGDWAATATPLTIAR